MPLFTKNKVPRVRSFVIKLVNNNCPELKSLIEGPRRDSRVNMTVVVMVIPLEGKALQVGQAFMAVTKEFSSTGVAVVLDHPRGMDEAILGFRIEGEMTYVRAKAKHLNPIGGGFYQLGFELEEIVAPGDYPKLQSLSF
ncbi:MAG: hypothetical protein KKE86_04965 [Planctomycetes bacterium]|nr:hypothetical protein [Planctomycetota bacterium]MBU4398669.1 hypothetical protein [Planctomycetota bacterium]MCG2683025.1 hypothetical protein [Planctomycetales bacterium]